ncbi:MAG TPA: hypothetical protein VEA16_09700 [Vicinamibacterales bacterium]|nr:hypothetical protein [Vicinamibacterales bacterium]
MTPPIASPLIRMRNITLGAAVIAAVIAAQYPGLGWLWYAGLFVLGVLALTLDLPTAIKGYCLTLSLQVGQPFGLFRLAVADIFMVPALIRTVFEAKQRGERLPASTLNRPFALLLLVLAIGLVIGGLTAGRLSGYVLFNRVAGVAVLLAAFFVLARYVTSVAIAVRLARWFVVATGVANLAALAIAGAAFIGIDPGTVYLVASLRLNGWVGNPSLYGSVLIAASLLELGMLGAAARPGDGRWWRWTNVWLMGLGIAMTVSRSTWLAGGAGAGALLLLIVATAPRLWLARVPHKLVVATWMLLPAAVLGSILVVSMRAGIETVDDRVAALQQMAQAQAMTEPAGMPSLAGSSAPVASPPPGAAAGVNTPTTAAEPTPTIAPPQPPVPAGVTAGSLQTALTPEGSVMNSRGLTDRAAIQLVAWERYRKDLPSTVFGIGLGTFLNESAATFGYSLIIHNTFLWFLVELGPLGLIAVLWIWWRTARNLWTAAAASDGRRYLAHGAFGALGALTVFCLVNEAFYQRHLWFVLMLADRMALLPPDAAGDLDEGPVL